MLVQPAKIADDLDALKPTWEGITSELECLFFDLWHHPDNPGTFKMLEVRVGDKEWFTNVQMKEEYYVPYHTVTEPWRKGTSVCSVYLLSLGNW
jgi:hypothetical protein